MKNSGRGLGPGQRLQALEGQAFGVLDAVKIEPANEGDDGVAIAIGTRNHGINGKTLGVEVMATILTRFCLAIDSVEDT